VSKEHQGPPPKKSKAQFAYEDEQEHLKAKTQGGRGKFVFLDPDGSWAPWLLLVIKAPTGVVYENQCAGTGTDHRLVEGYIVPVGGPWVNPNEGAIDIKALTAVFHEGKACVWSWKGNDIPQDRLDVLQKLVESIPYWECSATGDDRRLALKLDQTRLFEVAEGWIPIITPDGPGVLVFQNCD
jgi:hypothetical protein